MKIQVLKKGVDIELKDCGGSDFETWTVITQEGFKERLHDEGVTSLVCMDGSTTNEIGALEEGGKYRLGADKAQTGRRPAGKLFSLDKNQILPQILISANGFQFEAGILLDSGAQGVELFLPARKVVQMNLLVDPELVFTMRFGSGSEEMIRCQQIVNVSMVFDREDEPEIRTQSAQVIMFRSDYVMEIHLQHMDRQVQTCNSGSDNKPTKKEITVDQESKSIGEGNKPNVKSALRKQKIVQEDEPEVENESKTESEEPIAKHFVNRDLTQEYIDQGLDTEGSSKVDQTRKRVKKKRIIQLTPVQHRSKKYPHDLVIMGVDLIRKFAFKLDLANNCAEIEEMSPVCIS